jgi:hypothetical protein
MRKFALACAASAFAMTLCAGAASAGVVTMTYGAPLAPGDSVGDYFNGVGGPSYGVSYTPDWTVGSNFAYSTTGSGAVNVASGFVGGISFTYGAYEDADVSIYSGLNGTGTLLAEATNLDTGGVFTPDSLTFSGTGESIVIGTGPNQFAFGSLTLDDAVPEPAAWSLMLLGLGSIGAGLRISRRNAARLAV